MKRIIFLIALLTVLCGLYSYGQKSLINYDKTTHFIDLSDSLGTLKIQLISNGGIAINKLSVNGNVVINNGNKVFSGFLKEKQVYSSERCLSAPQVNISKNTVSISNILYGDDKMKVEEGWNFSIRKNDIQWQIKRKYINDGILDECYLPSWTFNSMQSWNGAMLDNGGVAWCKFLEKENFTYGAHATNMTLWNRRQNSCLRISVDKNSGLFSGASFSHIKDDKFAINQTYASNEIPLKYGLRRFIENGQDVFAPVTVSKSEITINYDLQALAYDAAYDRGKLIGINESSVNEILNTIGRYGVVDQNLYGSNGWRTGWAVLQEQWLALFGLAIDDADFIKGFSQTLEYYKDHAILQDGRVLPRWHHDASDAMPGTFQPDGFYECIWGYMLDAQPAYAIDVAEQFDMTGDLEWLRKFKPVCEKVLDYMIRRDTDNDGLFEVIQQSHKEAKGTDWLDVVWASHEVSTINALMYLALTRWSELELLIGDKNTSEKYTAISKKLKSSFNKNIADGGFWNPEKNWYVHWREADGSVYGNNCVNVVNFMAIGYGLCDDETRKEKILRQTEELMQKENLFIWPSCFFPYEENVGLKDINYPYPNYENGDFFLGWAELGSRCYVGKNPEIALKYIRNVIAKYEQDGLAHQRYKRLNAEGAGDDILANNAMAIVGLYRNIYGIRPQYNRLYIEPHLPAELIGTSVIYNLRGNQYQINLLGNKTIVEVGGCKISDSKPFAVNLLGSSVQYFKSKESVPTLKLNYSKGTEISVDYDSDGNMQWMQNAGSSVQYEVYRFQPLKKYAILANGEKYLSVQSNAQGIIHFDLKAKKASLISLKEE